MGNSAFSLGSASKVSPMQGKVGGMFSQYGMQPLNPTNTPFKSTGQYSASPNYQSMMQRLYGSPQLTGQYQTSKMAGQPSAMGQYGNANLMPYWMALVRRFMNGI